MANTKNTSPPKSAEILKTTATPTVEQTKKTTAGTKPKSATAKSSSTKTSPAKKQPSSTDVKSAPAPVAEIPAVPPEEDATKVSLSSANKAETDDAPLTSPSVETTQAAITPSPEQVEINQQIQVEIDQMIAEAAYYLAEKRNFEPGHEKEDWATASAEVLAKLRGGKIS